jgi:hypothetical protein
VRRKRGGKESIGSGSGGHSLVVADSAYVRTTPNFAGSMLPCEVIPKIAMSWDNTISACPKE